MIYLFTDKSIILLNIALSENLDKTNVKMPFPINLEENKIIYSNPLYITED